jgi:hypothetical protein
MTKIEQVLGSGKLHLLRGEPIPLTLLAEADELGLSLSELGQPTNAIDEDGNLTNKE